MKGIKILAIAAAAATGVATSSCLEDDVNTILVDPADPAQGANGGNNGGNGGNNGGGNKPGKPVSYDLRFYMTGLRNPDNGEWLRLVGSGSAGQNARVKIDGKETKTEFINSDDPEATVFKADIALLVDNSESMEEENDAIAAGIREWTHALDVPGLDVRYAAVGHSEEGTINGATDFSTAENLVSFFNYRSGRDRTAHFSGPGSDRLQREAEAYPTLNTECCMLALRFGDEQLSFREDAERVYISFTDEPNQPYGNAEYSADWLLDNWKRRMGEVHTVYSAEEPTEWISLISEPARLLSDRTGGTVTYTDPAMSGFSLAGYSLSDALTHSYIAHFPNIAEYCDGKAHQVEITAYWADGSVAGKKLITTVFTED